MGETNLALAATNGFFESSSCTFDGRVLSCELMHGGKDVLESIGAAECMEKIILKRFGRKVTVEFTGKTEISIDDEQALAERNNGNKEVSKEQEIVFYVPEKSIPKFTYYLY